MLSSEEMRPEYFKRFIGIELELDLKRLTESVEKLRASVKKALSEEEDGQASLREQILSDDEQTLPQKLARLGQLVEELIEDGGLSDNLYRLSYGITEQIGRVLAIMRSIPQTIVHEKELDPNNPTIDIHCPSERLTREEQGEKHPEVFVALKKVDINEEGIANLRKKLEAWIGELEKDRAEEEGEEEGEEKRKKEEAWTDMSLFARKFAETQIRCLDTVFSSFPKSGRPETDYVMKALKIEKAANKVMSFCYKRLLERVNGLLERFEEEKKGSKEER